MNFEGFVLLPLPDPDQTIIDERNQEIFEINRDLEGADEMFQIFARLIGDQGDELREAEENTDVARNAYYSANQELVVAGGYRREKDATVIGIGTGSALGALFGAVTFFVFPAGVASLWFFGMTGAGAAAGGVAGREIGKR
ncbi:MAG: hypothetical protein H7A37_04480 [Chlamydiales bacterium]|nr:hypothetical protein [Chlamydiia bacterium]MCP5507540.1 hypothetical protein [Chlamydiales bacterium]